MGSAQRVAISGSPAFALRAGIKLFLMGIGCGALLGWALSFALSGEETSRQINAIIRGSALAALPVGYFFYMSIRYFRVAGGTTPALFDNGSGRLIFVSRLVFSIKSSEIVSVAAKDQQILFNTRAGEERKLPAKAFAKSPTDVASDLMRQLDIPV